MTNEIDEPFWASAKGRSESRCTDVSNCEGINNTDNEDNTEMTCIWCSSCRGSCFKAKIKKRRQNGKKRSRNGSMYFKDDFCKGVKAVYFFLYFFCLKPSFFPRASVMLHARVPLTVALHAPEKKKTLKRAKHRRNLKSRESECARNA